jgi:Bardet-Biedl syndrome 4 protein
LKDVLLLSHSLGVSSCAKDYLGNALTHDPKNAKTILAAGSIIQERRHLISVAS